MIKEAETMPQDADWASYQDARRAALHGCADAQAAATSIGRAKARLRTYFGLEPDEAHVQARRCLLFSGDAAFHDQFLASGPTGLLRTLIEKTEADHPTFRRDRSRGAVLVSLHYGPATSMLPLWFAMGSERGLIPTFAVIQNSKNNPNVVLSAQRHAELVDAGFPFVDLDIARLGELGALRRALSILKDGGMVLIFADGQLPQPSAKRAMTCRLGRGSLVLACGAEWLARCADVPLQPILLQPKGDGHRLVSLPGVRPDQASFAIQGLLDAAMACDLAPWSRWCCSAEHL
jgi:hypothetical protein